MHNLQVMDRYDRYTFSCLNHYPPKKIQDPKNSEGFAIKFMENVEELVC